MNEFIRIKTVTLVGATGLVGSNLLEILKADISIGRIHILSRNIINEHHPKVKVHKVDFNHLNYVAAVFKESDTVFCCIGSTLARAGSKEEFLTVNFQLPVQLARISSLNAVKRFIVLSSAGADNEASNFYLKSKGEMETAISEFSFQKLAFVRPSLIIGKRKRDLWKESFYQLFLLLLSFLMIGKFKKFRPLFPSVVAKAMFSISHSLSNQKVYEYSDLLWLGS